MATPLVKITHATENGAPAMAEVSMLALYPANISLKITNCYDGGARLIGFCMMHCVRQA